MSIRVPEETASQREAREAFEAEAIRRFPGVEFWWSNGERRAKLRDSGIELWEAIRALDALDWDIDRVEAMWPYIPTAVITDAIRFYREQPMEIDARIARNDAFERAHLSALAEERSRYSG